MSAATAVGHAPTSVLRELPTGALCLELEEGASYNVTINGVSEGTMATNMGGKIVLSVSLEEGKSVSVEVVKA